MFPFQASASYSPKGQAGFTLTEVLVALFILALISTAGSGLLMGATASGKQIREQEEGARQIDIAQAFLRGDIGAMSSRAVKPLWGTGAAVNLFGEQPRGTLPFLHFVRNSWIVSTPNETRSSLQYVSYRLEEGALIRTARIRPDASEQTPEVDRVLLENIASLEIRFRRGVEWSDQWIGDVSQTKEAMPDLVEVNIGFANGTELVIAAITGSAR